MGAGGTGSARRRNVTRSATRGSPGGGIARVSIRDVRCSTKNVFLLWEYPFWHLEGFIQLTTCLRTLCHFNNDRVINLFSNALPPERLFGVPLGSNSLRIVSWTPDDLVRGTPFDRPGMDFGPDPLGWVHFSDPFRIACLWRWGGTYTDTDNICIAPLPSEKNLLSRTYDPHSFDKKGEVLVPGTLREGPDKARYAHIPFRLRQDPFVNFEPEHRFLARLVESAREHNVPRDKRWQALLTEVFMGEVDRGVEDVHARLLLVYFPDGRGCYDYSDHDKCLHGGEICDILFHNCPGIRHVGRYRTRQRQVAKDVLRDVYDAFPSGCFLWAKGHLHFSRWRKNKISNWIVRLIMEQTGAAC